MEQLIAYIGNKRRLLPFIRQEIAGWLDGKGIDLSSAAEHGTSGPLFVDLFAGSGAVSRLARGMGFKVMANDWELYSQVLVDPMLFLCRDDVTRLLGGEDALNRFVASLNQLPAPGINGQYIARHFAPASHDPSLADYRSERLFYTRANALAIDAVRGWLKEQYPAALAGLSHPEQLAALDRQPQTDDAGRLLLAMLLYQAATHVNTSGVFKACHKGFGGHGKDALRRILAPVTLTIPELPRNAPRGFCLRMDALEAARFAAANQPRALVAYLDPPYNQHQYGSNYHLLNTIALWDKPPVSDEMVQGRLRDKGGIRRDWTRTRSDYCRKASAAAAFSQLLEAVEARLIVVSYSTDGLVPLDELLALCSHRGQVKLVFKDYVQFRGGRQSSTRANSNLEFLILIDTDAKPASSTQQGASPGDAGVSQADLMRAYSALVVKTREPVALEKLRNHPCWDAGEQALRLPGIPGDRWLLPHREQDRIISLPPELMQGGPGVLSAASDLVDALVCRDRLEEIADLTMRWRTGLATDCQLAQLVPRVLRKLAHRKHEALFLQGLELARSLNLEKKSATALEEGLSALCVLLAKRKSG